MINKLRKQLDYPVTETARQEALSGGHIDAFPRVGFRWNVLYTVRLHNGKFLNSHFAHHWYR